MKSCNEGHIAFVFYDEKELQRCPLCLAYRLNDELETEIKELKTELFELKMACADVKKLAGEIEKPKRRLHITGFELED
jgi:hypothetical protein